MPEPLPSWTAKFLETLRDTSSVRLACQQAKVDRKTATSLRESDQSFAASWLEALEDARDILVAEARRRALESSDRLLVLLLKDEEALRKAVDDDAPDEDEPVTPDEAQALLNMEAARKKLA